MDTKASNIPVIIITSFVAVVLQIMIAPNIAINDVVPNFMLVAVVLIAINHGTTPSCTAGFVLGLLYDLFAQGPLGVMALILTILAYSTSSLNKGMFANSWLIGLLTLVVAALFGELLHSVFLTVIGSETEFLKSLVIRTLPSMLYDAVLGLVLFPILARFGSRKKTEPGVLKGRFR
ncbi:MAG: rod shape-determining protein MreD [Coriobacteriales bacterium]|jgi:rod shape-determining protein MreD|nr:rod shape-determining protein MreD [Coriobacteriales bacterium]